MRKNSVWIRRWSHKTTAGLLCPNELYRYWWKPYTQFRVITSDGDVIPPFNSLYALRLNTEAYIKCLKKVVVYRIMRGSLQEEPTSQNPTPCHSKQAGEPNVGCENISATPLHLKAGHQTLQIAISLFTVWGIVERETNKTPCNTKDELKARIMAAFTNLNKETVERPAGDSEVV